MEIERYSEGFRELTHRRHLQPHNVWLEISNATCVSRMRRATIEICTPYCTPVHIADLQRMQRAESQAPPDAPDGIEMNELGTDRAASSDRLVSSVRFDNDRKHDPVPNERRSMPIHRTSERTGRRSGLHLLSKPPPLTVLSETRTAQEKERKIFEKVLRGSALDPATENELKYRATAASNCKQQRFRGCRGDQTPFKAGVFFFAIGGLFLSTSVMSAFEIWDVVELRARYDATCAPMETNCTVTITAPQYMKAPIYIYYALEPFYQNHRHYVGSVSQRQLSGQKLSVDALEGVCEPAHTNLGKALYPCGLKANSVFNDTFVAYFCRAGLTNSPTTSAPTVTLNPTSTFSPAVTTGSPLTASPSIAPTIAGATKSPVTGGPTAVPSQRRGPTAGPTVAPSVAPSTTSPVTSTPVVSGLCDTAVLLNGSNWNNENIAWPSDLRTFSSRPVDNASETSFGYFNYRLPAIDMRDFIVWMRPGNGPFVTKIYRVIENLDLEKGDRLVFVVSNQYAVTDPYFRPVKHVIVTTHSALGGSDVFLALTLLWVGCMAVALAGACFVWPLTLGRTVGDLTYFYRLKMARMKQEKMEKRALLPRFEYEERAQDEAKIERKKTQDRLRQSINLRKAEAADLREMMSQLELKADGDQDGSDVSDAENVDNDYDAKM